MKGRTVRYVMLVCLMSLCLRTVLFAQGTASTPEHTRKDPLTGIVLGTLVPGGGLFYVGRTELGGAFAMLESASLGAVIYLRVQHGAGGELSGDKGMTVVWGSLFVALKTFHVLRTLSEIDQQNQRLSLQLIHDTCPVVSTAHDHPGLIALRCTYAFN